MTFTLTRRNLAAGLVTLVPLPAVAASNVSEPVTVAFLIRAHRDAFAAERRAVAECNAALACGSPAVANLREIRDTLRKARHAARRALRRITPRDGAELAALCDYYGTLVPSPDPQDVAGTCRRDLDAARERMGRAGA